MQTPGLQKVLSGCLHGADKKKLQGEVSKEGPDALRGLWADTG